MVARAIAKAALATLFFIALEVSGWQWWWLILLVGLGRAIEDELAGYC